MTQPRAKGQRLASPREPKSPEHEYDNRAIFFMRRKKAILLFPDLSRHLLATFSSLDCMRPLLCTQPLFTLTSCVRSQSLAITVPPTLLPRRHTKPNSSSRAWLACMKPGHAGPLPPLHVLLVCYRGFGYKNATPSWLARKCKNVGIVHKGAITYWGTLSLIPI